MKLTEFKSEFKDRQGTQLNNAGMSPTANRVAMRAIAMVTEFNRSGALHEKNTLLALRDARANLAKFLGADPTEIAYLPNCAAGLSQIAFGQKLSADDTVVTVDQEYASNFYPWKVAAERAGANLTVVKSDTRKQISLEDLIDVIRPGVKCVAVSWVQFQAGALIDLKILGEHCHSVGAKLVVDGIQGIGQLPISFHDLPIDALVGGSHKWVCGLGGQGFLAVKKDWLPFIDPITVGSGTFNRFGTFADREAKMELSARKFEAGGLNFTTIFALDEALKLLNEVGVATIAAEISRLSARFREGLQRLSSAEFGSRELGSRELEIVTPMKQAGGITSFILPIAAEARFLALCQNENCAVVKRGEFLRVSIHAFNTDSEIDKVLGLVETALGEFA
jgi:cysteine desulfurase/selenocysteine lyase